MNAKRNPPREIAISLQSHEPTINQAPTVATMRAASTVDLWDQGSIASLDDDSSAHQREAIADKNAERTTLARKEHIAVTRMKIAVGTVLLVASILVASGVFLYTRADQKQDFEDSFKADANRLLESFHKSVERSLEAVDALSVTITSHALKTNSTFPNVTLPNSAMRFGNTRVLSGSPFVFYYPLVSDTTRPGWEAYVQEQGAHSMEAFVTEEGIRAHQDAKFGRNSSNHPQRILEAQSLPGIFHFGPGSIAIPDEPNTGPYLALWQMSPVLPPLLNTNALKHPLVDRVFKESVRTAEAVIDLSVNAKDDEVGSSEFFAAILSMSQYRYDVNEYTSTLDPASFFVYPVFDTFDLASRKMVGAIATILYWRLYFKDVLPPDTKGIHCVLENSRGQTFTYLIDENNVNFLGDGDQHDPKYDHLVQSGDLAAYLASITSPETKSFTSVDLNTDFVRYTLRIFPSQATENRHVNQDPTTVCLVIVSVFVFTSLVFVMYTVAVNRHQQVVMDRAVASSAIVSSLFPSQVRDQIYHENKDDKTQLRHNSVVTGHGFSRPIAQLYEKTTILFADIAGFTAWSAKRDPVQVFELLETIYKAFDTIAVRRKVFKVETIGDCYVAVTGLPEPQDDHAVIMAKFANDCMIKMNQLTTELVSALGEETAELEMRVGLHSGSVTGGVLRGQKSRFQLFGDTMNTASRMESNGVRGKIHVSQETATELMAKGKSSWVTPRGDKIVAKGKGELQTFWVTPSSAERGHLNSVMDTDEFDGTGQNANMVEL